MWSNHQRRVFHHRHTCCQVGEGKKKIETLLYRKHQTHRFPFRLQVLHVARELRDDLGRQVLGDHLVLARIVVQLVERGQEGPAEGVPAEEQGVRWQEEAEQHFDIFPK